MYSIDIEDFNFRLSLEINDLLDIYKKFDHTHPDVIYQVRFEERLAEMRKRDPFIYR